MMSVSPESFRESVLKQAQQPHFGQALKSASLEGRLSLWTRTLTACVVASCREIGLRASARGHQCELLPVRRSEYLALDVMAFAAGEKRWLYPAAIMELENIQPDKIAYSLWKVLCVSAGLNDQIYNFIHCLTGAINPKSVLVVAVPASLDFEMTPADVEDYNR